jgi:uncharacterized membrane protein YqgA involved in biofilm formation
LNKNTAIDGSAFYFEGKRVINLLGTIVNAAAIIVGALLGKILGRGLPENIKNTVLQGLGLGVLLVGATMALETNEIMVVLVSLMLGAVIGEAVGIEKILEAGGNALERKVSANGGKGDIAKGFVTGTLIYCVGAMAIMGALESGLRANYDILYAKSLLDGVMSIVLASTLGVGVAFSALSVFVYQGTITLLAQWISQYMTDPVIAEVTSTGGLLIVGIGLTILEIKTINIGNLLPAILVAFILAVVLQSMGMLG